MSSCQSSYSIFLVFWYSFLQYGSSWSRFYMKAASESLTVYSLSNSILDMRSTNTVATPSAIGPWTESSRILYSPSVYGGSWILFSSYCWILDNVGITSFMVAAKFITKDRFFTVSWDVYDCSEAWRPHFIHIHSLRYFTTIEYLLALPTS